MFFKVIVTIESGSTILVGPCQLIIVYANNQKNQRKECKNDYSQFQFIFLFNESRVCLMEKDSVTLLALISHLLKNKGRIEKIACAKGAIYVKCK